MNESGDIEVRIREAFDVPNNERAATLAIEHYGPEIMGFLIAHLHDDQAAHEVFSDFCEAFWSALPRFEWRCTIRTWAYKLARRTAARHRKRSRRHACARPLTQLSQLSQAIEHVRSATVPYRRTDLKAHFRQLRASLPEEDQMLLVLRVDRGMTWLELAEVMGDDELSGDDARLKMEAARLRKRFQLAKERLRERMLKAGLLE